MTLLLTNLYAGCGTHWALNPWTGCWHWTKGKTEHGYPWGHMHRVYWRRRYGSIPEGHQLHHICHNTSCVNPDHLVPMIQRDHHEQHVLERRGLTLDDIAEMYRLGAETTLGLEDVAERYGWHRNQVSLLWKGKTWPAITQGVAVRPQVDCERCGTPIVDGRRHKRFCSKRCQQARKKAA